jgi:hypothetical protein
VLLSLRRHLVEETADRLKETDHDVESRFDPKTQQLCSTSDEVF